MKNILKSKILPITVLMVVFVSCKKDEYIFDESPDNRLNEALTKYQSALTSSAAGWKATMQPALGGTYNFFFQFNDQNRVFMFADIDTATARNKRESSYRLKALEQPSLIFDTYSYIHVLSDPDPAVIGGAEGAGLISDFEFVFESANADSIVLIGNRNKTRLKLEKATQDDLDAWQNGIWLNMLSFLNIQKIEQYFKRLNVAGTIYEIAVNPVGRVVKIQWLSGGNLQTVISPYYLTSQGLMLATPVVNGSQTIDRFANFSWNENTKILQLTAGSVAGSIAGAIAPLKVDLQAPARWWQAGNTGDAIWLTQQGFHVNGVDDAYGLRSIRNFWGLGFWPQYSTTGSIQYDLAGYIMNNGGLSLDFGTAFSAPTFTADGKIIFNYLGDLGTIPDNALDPYINTALKITEPTGYYLIQVGPESYDMVNVADARSWIVWDLW